MNNKKQLNINNDEQFIDSMHKMRSFLNCNSYLANEKENIVRNIKNQNGDIQVFFRLCIDELVKNFSITMYYTPEDNTFLLSHDVNDHQNVIYSAIYLWCEENWIYHMFD